MPNTACQLDVEEVSTEVIYIMTNTQPSYAGGGESDLIPNTSKEAMGLPYKAGWKSASDKELASLEKHGILKLVPITSVPARHNVGGTKWVFKIKVNSTYKGRLVVQGFFKIPAVGCGDIFAPVCRLQSIRMMIVVVVNKLKKKLVDRFEMFDVGHVSRILVMNVTRDSKKRAITMSHKD